MSLKIKPTYETEVYVSKGGYLTVMQNYDQEDHHVMLSPEQAEEVIKEMTRILQNKDQWWTATAGEREDEA